jgi:hypothetical protein
MGKRKKTTKGDESNDSIGSVEMQGNPCSIKENQGKDR